MSKRDTTAPGRLRVAIDTSFLALPPSGIGTYVRGLREAMPAAAPDIDLIELDPGWDAPDPSAPVWRRLAADPRARRFQWDLLGVAAAARPSRPALLHIPQLAAPLRPPSPLVVTVHDAIPFLLPDYRRSRAMRFNLAVMRRTVRRADRLIAPSRAAATDISRVLGIPPSRLMVVPMAAAPDLVPGDSEVARHFVSQRFGIDGDYVFNIAGFDRRKNLSVLIEAFARVLPRIDWPLSLVIGGAPHSGNQHVFPDLRPLVARLGLETRVVFTGKVSDEERRALYQAASVYATPSLYEGFGLTPLEAMACGVPVVVADRTSLPEVVADAGLAVAPTAEAFAEALVTILADSSLRARLCESGLARAREFSWARTARETAAVYREIARQTDGVLP